MFPPQGPKRRSPARVRRATGRPRAPESRGSRRGRREGGGGQAPEEAADRTGGGGGGLGAPGASPRFRTPRPWTAARTPPGPGRAAATGGQAELGKPRSRRALTPAAAGPATRAASPGPGLRSPALLAAVETMEGGRAQARPAPPPLPPSRRLNPFAAPAAPGRGRPGGPRPVTRPPRACGLSGPRGVRNGSEASFQRQHSLSPRKWLIIRGNHLWGRGGDVPSGWEGSTGKTPEDSRRLPGSQGHWSSSPPGSTLPPQHPLVDALSVLLEGSPSKDP